MTSRKRDARHWPTTWVGYGAAAWALIFAVFHLTWASGWYIGLDQEEARVAFAKPWMLGYDLIVAGLCVLAVPVALALVMPWGRRLPRPAVGLLAWTGTGLLVLRSAGSLVEAAYLLVTRHFTLAAMGIWEFWFYLGAVLFSVSTWRFWRAPVASGAA